MSQEVYNQFNKSIKANLNLCYKDYLLAKGKVANSTAIYKGEPVEFLYQGLFYSESEYKELKKLLNGLNSILDKVINEYKNNPVFRSYFAFSDLMEELILINPGYTNNFPMGRFDIFYEESGQHKFCELNADGASAMNEVRVIQNVIYDSLASQEILKNYNLKKFELFYSWIDSLLDNYREFNNGVDDKPNIAIVDFDGDGTISEFKEFQKRFIQSGYQTVICDPRELKYINGYLYYNDIKIKLVYRRATTIRLIEKADFISDFLNAYRDGAVCVVGGLVSQIIHNKVLFAILHDYDKVSFLNEDDKAFIKNHIPYTKIIDFQDIELIKKIKNQKDRWILKPFDQYAGKGVYAGKDFEDKRWNDIIDKNINSEYIVQEYINVPQCEMAYADKQLRFEDFGYLLGLFSYNQRLTGLYTRAGRKSIIGAIAESFTVPNYIYREV